MTRQKRQYVSDSRNNKKEETRTLVLESAKSLFEKVGFERATIRSIASHAGVSVGTIFNYFPNKSFLLVAALLDDLEKVEKLVFAHVDEHNNIIDKCVYVAKTYYAYYIRRPALSRVLIKESNFVQGEFGELLSNRTNRFISRVYDLMCAAQKNGEIAPSADCQLAATAYFSFFMWHLFVGLNAPKFELDTVADMIGKLLEQHLKGLGSGS